MRQTLVANEYSSAGQAKWIWITWVCVDLMLVCKWVIINP